MVLISRLELERFFNQGILNPPRLPITPYEQIWRRVRGSNSRITINDLQFSRLLQSTALPTLQIYLVLLPRFELGQCFHQKALNLPRLPITPQEHVLKINQFLIDFKNTKGASVEAPLQTYRRSQIRQVWKLLVTLLPGIRIWSQCYVDSSE